MDRAIEKEIIEFVRTRPRTIQEIARTIGKNWRTADRYVQKIAEETGTIAAHTFRGGTRGALKIVYLVDIARLAGTQAQDLLLSRILSGRRKEDFSPLDIYQYVPEEKRHAFVEHLAEETITDLQDLASMLRSARKQILLFSGNLSWVALKQRGEKISAVLEETARRGIAIKVLTRVDIASLKNLAQVLAINQTLGRDAVEIRHAEQPLRSTIIDSAHVRLKETKDPGRYKPGELDAQTFIFYDILDEDWIAWLQKVFWKLYSTAIPAKQRLDALESITRLSVPER